MPEDKAAAAGSGENSTSSAPTISLPKGGGAIRGMGEKVGANPVTGTGSMSVSIATSPGRSGFGPQLSLSYDSGAGNGPFGFGWSLSLPAITRKTDKGLPQYRDSEESDVFILSAAEDLVPVLGQAVPPRTVDGVDYRIQRYRPRIEGLFARIERWTSIATGETHWRSITRDNVTTLYGKDNDSRIFDPSDPHPDHPTRIFSWLICQSYDDKGNAIVYTHAKESNDGVDLGLASERNRVRTANRYLKRIRYGNRAPNRDLATWQATDPSLLLDSQWMFEVVFDYGEHDRDAPTPNNHGTWAHRVDAFSSYRAGFEVRTCRRCRRVLMFHHFADEPEIGRDCLVRSTDFEYSPEQEPRAVDTPVYSFLYAVTQWGYRRQNGGYLKRNLPPVEFTYTEPLVQDVVQEVDAQSLENLPIGLDGASYEWTDLHGEGIPGILTEQAGAWFYKRNISPISKEPVGFAPLERVATKPNLALAGGQAQFMDLAGDGQPDLVVLDGPMPGLYEHDDEESWQSFRLFTSRLTRDTRDPNVKLVDLDGDGHADVLITEDDALVWHPSLAEQGFSAARRISQALDEEDGPRLVFADGTQSIYLADLSGDGLTDLVRIRNGEICYWPNLGYGRFGAKVTMDNAPWFDEPEQFDHKRIRVADIDGSGTTDLIYLHRDGVRLYFNQSGNSWSIARALRASPRVDDVVAITALDLLGNGTACLVWSSALSGDARRQMRYVDLMGGKKPHLLVKTVNNLGAETHVEYAPSTKFYLRDKYDGKPWITRLPFPVHVVERVETYDWISRNWFVTRYAYHHGYFDGEEREFRGFGMVEQRDTEEFGDLTADWTPPDAANLDAASHVPPVLTKTWFHTGAYLRDQEISRHLAQEYFGAPQDEADFAAWAQDNLLDDTVLPDVALTADEERQAVRALKGAMLRQEVYAVDGTAKAGIPYTVTEQNFTIRRLQPQDDNRHAVFFTHSREAISYHYERDPGDARVGHTLTLEADEFGNVLRSVVVGYSRANVQERQPEQNETHLTLTLSRFANADDQPDWRRIGAPVETRTYELVKPPTASPRYAWKDLHDLAEALVPLDQVEPPIAKTTPYEEWDWRRQWNPQIEPGGLANTRLRLIEHVRSRYRPDDLGVARNDPLALLDLGTVGQLSLPGQSCKLAFRPALLTAVYGGRVTDAMLAPEGGYIHSEGDANWWIPSGLIFYSGDNQDTAAQELDHARQHFFLPQRYRDPFHTDAVPTETRVSYDTYDLLAIETRDALLNVVTTVTQDENGESTNCCDYRVLQPFWVTDPNGNRTKVAFDALGMVVATAVMGKSGEVPVPGDRLAATFHADLTQVEIDQVLADPKGPTAATLLDDATTRVVYDLTAYWREPDPKKKQPAVAATFARETHVSEGIPSGGLQIQANLSYSDGFGREIQKKIQAEPGPVPVRDAAGKIVVGADGQPQMTPNDAPRRWVGSGWTVFNNKGKPVRKYEPFFTDTHRFEFDARIGVSSVLFYDPVERVVATLHPNHTYEKVGFDPWSQATYDVNDTVAANARETGDPRTDPDIGGYVAEYFKTQPNDWKTWHQERVTGAQGADEQDAATKAAVHANTPTRAHFDTLGRPFLTIAHNKFDREKADGTKEVVEETYPTRVTLDIEGNLREVRDAVVQDNDALGRVVMRYDYDMLGSRAYQASLEAGERWTLNDVVGKPIRAWDSRGHAFKTEYDPLRRALRSFVTGADPANPNQALLTERLVYGEQHAEHELRKLRGKLYLHLDQAGTVSNDAYDFKGNLLSASRRLAQEYRQAVDWKPGDAALPTDSITEFDPAVLEAAVAPLFEAETFESTSTFDALNRLVTLTTPDKSVVHHVYNAANLLEGVTVNLRGAAAATPFVTNIDYNPKGQRTLIDYQNGASTTYGYDPHTFRLISLKTTRPAGVNGLGQQLFADPTIVQDLHYAYDPTGNITTLRDDALPVIQYNGQDVKPRADFTYDAIYRLIVATGREHIGQTGFDCAPADRNYRDYPFVRFLANPNDFKALRNYTEHYDYDEVGNILSMDHAAAAGAWSRDYTYQEPSLLEATKKSNRLSSTVGNGIPAACASDYGYDAHGNMTSMRHLSVIRWDFHDQLLATAQQVVNAGTPETTWYAYGADGQRVRKVTDNAAAAGDAPARKAERIYLGSFEIYREFNGAANPIKLERETLHVMDDKQRVALVDTRTQGNEPGLPPQLIRYALSNHLGSSSLELADDGALISYEEYHPFGTSAFQAGRSVAEVSLKRYRYTGKERDEESGLYYYGVRYYASWLGRWTKCDPEGMLDGINVYVYVRNNALRYTDQKGTFVAEAVVAAAEATLAAEAADVASPDPTHLIPVKWVVLGVVAVAALATIGGVAAYRHFSRPSPDTVVPSPAPPPPATPGPPPVTARESAAAPSASGKPAAPAPTAPTPAAPAPAAPAPAAPAPAAPAPAAPAPDAPAGAPAPAAPAPAAPAPAAPAPATPAPGAPAPARPLSPKIDPKDLTGKTPDELRQMAKDLGLVPHKTKPNRWLDPVTGKQRLRLDPGHVDKATGLPYDDPNAANPHVHGYDPSGKIELLDPLTKNPHFPTK